MWNDHCCASQNILLQTPMNAPSSWTYGLYSFAIYRPVSFWSSVSFTYQRQKLSSDQIASLYKHCPGFATDVKTCNVVFSFINHSKSGIWDHLSTQVPRDLGLWVTTAASITERFHLCSALICPEKDVAQPPAIRSVNSVLFF